MPKAIYLLPGRAGRLNKGLGEELHARGYDIYGRETVGEFLALSFPEQIEIVAKDIEKYFWHADAKIIANSYGAYLFLHAQILLPPFVGRVLLLSPIVGEVLNEERMTYAVPPRAGKLQELANDGKYPAPASCEIYVGELDWQSDPNNVMELASKLRFTVTVVPKGGHLLDKGYVKGVLDRWLM
jgi:hypothetical protein